MDNQDLCEAQSAGTAFAHPVTARGSLVWRMGGLEVALRPGGLLLLGGMAALFDVRCWQLASPAPPALGAHVAAAVMTLLIVALTMLHEGGHALALRLQGAWPVRITLHGGGGMCAAVVVEDSAGRALVRALAGPAVAGLVLTLWLALCRGLALPPVWQLSATTVTAVGLCNVLVDTLPLHPRSDGVQALRAVLWLVRRRQPDRCAVLYLWRPLILAALAPAFALPGAATDLIPFGPATSTAVALVTLALCVVPIAVMARRALARCGSAIPGLRPACCGTRT